MRRKFRNIVFVIIALLFSLTFAGCSSFNDEPPQAAEDEIMLKIQLDLKEDIGLLIIDANMNGVETSGGSSHADKSMLKQYELLYWTFDKERYGNPADTVNLTLRFRVITEYCDPNYDNDYPEEYTMLIDALSFRASFGETYSVTITGDNVNGYQAVLNEQ